MSAYIKPPDGKSLTWSSGPPPSVGWWPAATHRNPTALRFWNGSQWSYTAWAEETAREAAKAAKFSTPKSVKVEWAPRWWPERGS